MLGQYEKIVLVGCVCLIVAVVIFVAVVTLIFKFINS